MRGFCAPRRIAFFASECKQSRDTLGTLAQFDHRNSPPTRDVTGPRVQICFHNQRLGTELLEIEINLPFAKHRVEGRTSGRGSDPQRGDRRRRTIPQYQGNRIRQSQAEPVQRFTDTSELRIEPGLGQVLGIWGGDGRGLRVYFGPV